MSDQGDTKPKKASNATIPVSIMEKAKKAGATIEKIEDEDLYKIELEYGSPVIEEWVSGLPDKTDPWVVIVFAPSVNNFNTTLRPLAAQVPAVLQEAGSIRDHYAPFTSASFVGMAEPVIPGPVIPAPATQVQHAKIALMKLHGRIQNPNDPNYPAIMGLGSGCYICSVFTQWSNCAMVTSITKV